MSMVRAGIVGATGYVGADLVRLLAEHPEIQLTILTSRQFAGKPISEAYPAFRNRIDLICEDYSADQIAQKADIIFLAVPHQVSMKIVPELIQKGLKVIDLSADFRFSDIKRYEKHYQPHSAKDLVGEAVYGLCEINKEAIRTARLIGNPGCYPTSVALPLIPLLKAGLIQSAGIIVDSKSGSSGAGRSLGIASHFCEVNESFKAYKVNQHRHAPEMEEVLENACGTKISITFVPHLLPITRGMLSTIYTQVSKNTTKEKIYACLTEFYKNASFVRIYVPEQVPDTLDVRGTNFCDIGFVFDSETGRLVLLSAIDNLMKGAAGQAVQNMNIMLGLNETTGLWQLPMPL